MYDFYRAEWHRVKTASPEGRSMERVVNAIADSFLGQLLPGISN